MPKKPWLDNNQQPPAKPWLDERQSFDTEPLLSNANIFNSQLFGQQPAQPEQAPIQLDEFQPQSTLQPPIEGAGVDPSTFDLSEGLSDMFTTGRKAVSKGLGLIPKILHEGKKGLQRLEGEPVGRYNQFRQDEILGEGVEGAIPLNINQLKYEAGTSPITNLVRDLFTTDEEQRGVLEKEALKEFEDPTAFGKLRKAESRLASGAFGLKTVVADFIAGTGERLIYPEGSLESPTGELGKDTFEVLKQEGQGFKDMIVNAILQAGHLANELAVQFEDITNKPRGTFRGSDDPAGLFRSNVGDFPKDFSKRDRGAIAVLIERLWETFSGEELSPEKFRELANQAEANPELIYFAGSMLKHIPKQVAGAVKGIPTGLGVKESGRFGVTENLGETFQNALNAFNIDAVGKANKGKSLKDVSRETQLSEAVESPEFKFQRKIDKAEDAIGKKKKPVTFDKLVDKELTPKKPKIKKQKKLAVEKKPKELTTEKKTIKKPVIESKPLHEMTKKEFLGEPKITTQKYASDLTVFKGKLKSEAKTIPKGEVEFVKNKKGKLVKKEGRVLSPYRKTTSYELTPDGRQVIEKLNEILEAGGEGGNASFPPLKSFGFSYSVMAKQAKRMLSGESITEHNYNMLIEAGQKVSEWFDKDSRTKKQKDIDQLDSIQKIDDHIKAGGNIDDLIIPFGIAGLAVADAFSEKEVDDSDPSPEAMNAVLGLAGLLGVRKSSKKPMKLTPKGRRRIENMMKELDGKGGASVSAETFKRAGKDGIVVQIKSNKPIPRESLTPEKIHSLISKSNKLWGEFADPVISLTKNAKDEITLSINAVFPKTEAFENVAKVMGSELGKKTIGDVVGDKFKSIGIDFKNKELVESLLPVIGAGTAIASFNSLSDDDKNNVANIPILTALFGIMRNNKYKKKRPKGQAEKTHARDVIREQHHMGKSKRPKIDANKVIFNIRKTFFDMNARVADYQKAIEISLGKKLHGEEAPYNLLTAVNRTAQSKAEQWINFGTADFDGRKTGESLRNIIESIEGDGFNTQDVLDFTYARHARERITAGKNAGISYDVADYIYKQDKAKFEKYANRIVDYRRNLLDYLVDAGGLSKETAEGFRELYEYSVPLYRVMEDGKVTGGAGHGAGGRGFGDLPSPIKRAKGSDLPVNNILGNLMYETYRIISFADRVRVGKSIVESSKLVEGGLPDWVRPVPPKTKAIMKRSLGDVTKQVISQLNKLDDVSVDILGKENIDWEQMMTFWGKETVGIPKENIVTFWKDGKLEMYELDAELYKAVKAIDPPSLSQMFGWFGKAITFPKQVVTAGATGFRASFGLVTNALRDPFTMAMQSRSFSTMPPEVVIGQYKVAMKKLFGKSDSVTDLYFQQGGEMSNLFNSEIPKAMTNAKKLIEDAERTQFREWIGFERGKKTNDLYLRHPIDAYREFINLPESAPRLVEFNKEYNKVLKETGNHRTAWIEAFNSSKDVTVNFSRAGTIGYVINQIIPFFNAQLQDYSVFYRTLKRNPVGSMVKGATGLTIPTLILWNLNKDEEWYRALPAWRKIGFWNFKIGDSPIMSIPRPFSWGIAFASMPEIAMDYAYQKDSKKTMKELGQILDYASPPLLNETFYADVPWVGTLIEANQGATGYSNFMNRPLVSQYVVDNTIPEERWNRYTTETSKKIGKLLGVAPIKVDHIIRGMTGGLGLDAIRAFEKSPVGKRAIEREPFLSRVMTPPPFQNYLYERMDFLKEESTKIANKKKEDITKEDAIIVLQKKWLDKKLKQLSKVRKKILAIIVSDLPRGQKDELVTEYDRRVEELAKDYTHEYLLVSDAKKKLLTGKNKQQGEK